MRTILQHAALIVAALSLGAVGAFVATQRLDTASTGTPPPGDRARTIIENLDRDPVYVAPDGRAMLSQADEAALEQIIIDRDLPVRIFVGQASRSAGYDHPSISLSEQIVENLDEPALLVLWQGPDNSTTDTPLDYSARYPDYDEEWTDAPEFLGEASLRLTEWLQVVPPDVLEERTRSDYYDGVGGGIAAGVLMGGGIALGVWVLVGFVRVCFKRPFLFRRPTT